MMHRMLALVFLGLASCVSAMPTEPRVQHALFEDEHFEDAFEDGLSPAEVATPKNRPSKLLELMSTSLIMTPPTKPASKPTKAPTKKTDPPTFAPAKKTGSHEPVPPAKAALMDKKKVSMQHTKKTHPHEPVPPLKAALLDKKKSMQHTKNTQPPTAAPLDTSTPVVSKKSHLSKLLELMSTSLIMTPPTTPATKPVMAPTKKTDPPTFAPAKKTGPHEPVPPSKAALLDKKKVSMHPTKQAHPHEPVPPSKAALLEKKKSMQHSKSTQPPTAAPLDTSTPVVSKKSHLSKLLELMSTSLIMTPPTKPAMAPTKETDPPTFAPAKKTGPHEPVPPSKAALVDKVSMQPTKKTHPHNPIPPSMTALLKSDPAFNAYRKEKGYTSEESFQTSLLQFSRDVATDMLAKSSMASKKNVN